MNKSSTYKESMTWIFLATPNALELYTKQKMSYQNAQKWNAWNIIDINEKLESCYKIINPKMLHHFILLKALSEK